MGLTPPYPSKQGTGTRQCRYPGGGRCQKTCPGGVKEGESALKNGDEIIEHSFQVHYLRLGGMPSELPVALLAKPCHQPSARIRKDNAINGPCGLVDEKSSSDVPDLRSASLCRYPRSKHLVYWLGDVSKVAYSADAHEPSFNTIYLRGLRSLPR